jgi:hypothetical protein
MAPLFDDALRRDHHDAVGIADGGEAVDDDERGAPFREFRERSLDRRLRFRVESRGRLVQDQDRWVLQEDPRRCFCPTD